MKGANLDFWGDMAKSQVLHDFIRLRNPIRVLRPEEAREMRENKRRDISVEDSRNHDTLER